MNTIKAIIFDMDGVLIDAKEWHYEALNKALSLFGFEISRHDHLVTYDGLPTKRKLEMFSLEKGLPTGLHKFINQMKQIYTMEITYANCKPVFSHERALAKLKTEGYKLGLCSNSIRNTIDLMMQKSDLIQYLDFVLSNEDVKKAKPDPEIYNKMIDKMNLHPSECLILEDNKNGIKAALDSGAHLLEIQTVNDVNYEAIKHRIMEVENK